jgi:tryptophanyl-tRNA synthetase
LKVATAEAVIEFLRPVQVRYAELTDDPAEVERRLKSGADAAEAIAEPVLQRATKAAGLLPRP